MPELQIKQKPTDGGVVSFENRGKNWKKTFLFTSKIRILDTFLKLLYKESFEDLEINNNWKFQTPATMS